METLHLHVLPLLHIFVKAKGSTGCCYKPFAAATDLHLLHQSRWLETTSMQPQSIFYPANPSAGCQICFHIDQLLFSLAINKKTHSAALFFPPSQMQTLAVNSSLKRQIIARQRVMSRRARDIIE